MRRQGLPAQSYNARGRRSGEWNHPPGHRAAALSQPAALAGNRIKGKAMLHYALVFLIVALVAGFFGFFGVAGIAAEIAKILFIVFLVLFVASFIFGRRRP